MTNIPLTVTQMRNRFQKLVDEGYGSVPVLTRHMNGAQPPKLVNREAIYIGASEWDNRTYTLDDEGTGLTVLI